MMAKQYQAYQDNSVTTASGPQLTLMLYNGCIKFINQAKQALENENIEAKNEFIQKAQNIVQELMITLDPEIEISNQMMPLYEYIHYQLQQANIKNESSYLDEAYTYVVDFRDTWKEVIKLAAKNNKREKI
ncbi:MAG TPA: flagellar export chaperone FliS [Candidatus Pseudogracilibacillus intestinigallinarum]|uniref:Flagellar secretion chaperone FliS n=1 Tax=Candidatus Pseudogracilibacillus intestinigallinarum TaxID=2838742 RepID=A0A9D1TJW2_9BACI|nr:flagellar export chaperone FliS [Candidatus Pseudogracilibacillus intestinigallinarum]